jgi:hypothetical protein
MALRSGAASQCFAPLKKAEQALNHCNSVEVADIAAFAPPVSVEHTGGARLMLRHCSTTTPPFRVVVVVVVVQGRIFPW